MPPFPGVGAFVLGKTNPAVTQLDKELITKGFTRHHDGNGYQTGPWFTEYTRRNVADFQRSRAELRADPDGYPGPLTWKLLHS
ncbi:peptidoglycan-binding protein [Streptomyces sp. NPDC002814]